MRRKLFFKLLLCFILFNGAKTYGQVPVPPGWYHDPKPHKVFRGLFSKIHWEVTPGMGRTFFSHKPEGFGVYSGAQGIRLFNPASYNSTTDSISGSLVQWINTSETGDRIYVGQDDFIVNTDTTNLRIRGKDFFIPISLTAYVIIDRFKIGAGLSFDTHFIGNFGTNDFKNRIEPWKPDIPVSFFKHYYGMLGANIWRNGNWMFSGDLRIGVWNPGRNYNMPLMQRAITYNLGLGLERELSEYLSVYLRPSFELKSYVLSVPESSFTIKHRIDAARLNFGIIWRLPELPKCVIHRCHIQINHLHGDREYRSRMHPIWKKQNPNYGENYPTLIMYQKNVRKTKSVY